MYISIESLLESRNLVRENINKPDTFVGIILLLLCSNKIQDFYYCADMSYFSNLANSAFTLKEMPLRRNDKNWYALFTPYWANRTLKTFLKGKTINIYILLSTVFWYQDKNFITKQKDSLVSLIGEKDFYILFKDSDVDIFHSENQVDKDLLLNQIKNNISDDVFTIKYDNNFIKKDAGDLNSAPFGQTLYSALEIRNIVNIFEFDILGEFYSIKDVQSKQLPFFDNLPNTNQKPIIRQKPQNLLLYGVAGVGKSHYINQMIGSDENFIERVVFHPDYSNADFIGQILPTVENGIISYKFKAGAFTKILKKALDDKNNHYYLVIEEINRGNAPAIFGEIFQLLDRKDTGESSYKVSHELIAKSINENSDSDFIYIPSNLSILATMNSADQNVFTLDTAFQRRWTMRMIENNIDKCNYKNEHIVDTNITWGVFNTVINQCILEANKNTLSSEDKRLGAFFIKENELSFTSMEDNSPFAEKVIKYLWDDVFRFNKSQLFNDEYNSLDEILRLFKNNHGNDRFNIFNMDIKSKLIEQSQNDGREEISDDLQFD